LQTRRGRHHFQQEEELLLRLTHAPPLQAPARVVFGAFVSPAYPDLEKAKPAPKPAPAEAPGAGLTAHGLGVPVHH